MRITDSQKIHAIGFIALYKNRVDINKLVKSIRDTSNKMFRSFLNNYDTYFHNRQLDRVEDYRSELDEYASYIDNGLGVDVPTIKNKHLQLTTKLRKKSYGKLTDIHFEISNVVSQMKITNHHAFKYITEHGYRSPDSNILSNVNEDLLSLLKYDPVLHPESKRIQRSIFVPSSIISNVLDRLPIEQYSLISDQLAKGVNHSGFIVSPNSTPSHETYRVYGSSRKILSLFIPFLSSCIKLSSNPVMNKKFFNMFSNSDTLSPSGEMLGNSVGREHVSKKDVTIDVLRSPSTVALREDIVVECFNDLRKTSTLYNIVNNNISMDKTNLTKLCESKAATRTILDLVNKEFYNTGLSSEDLDIIIGSTANNKSLETTYKHLEVQNVY